MSGETGKSTGSRLWPAAKLLLLTVVIFAAALAVWKLSTLLLLVFGAILLALLFRSFADLIAEYTPLPSRWSLLAAGIIIVAILAVFLTVVGSQLTRQLSELIDRIPALVAALQARFPFSDIEGWLQQRAGGMMSADGVLSNVAGYSSWIAGIFANVVLVAVAGIYLAINPQLYCSGLLQLFPPADRDEARDTIETLAGALKLWLVGQLGAMILVGTLTTLGLYALGIESALALGFLAGLLEFVPFVGPILSAIPAVGLALATDPWLALWVLGLYLLVQQIEGYLITPLVQQRTVDLPPVLTIFAIVGFGILFGPLGILFATPLAVVCFVLVKKLWVQETLGEETEIPGDPHPHSRPAK